MANALPPGPLEPLRLRGDASGNYLTPEDEAATTDDDEVGSVPFSVVL